MQIDLVNPRSIMTTVFFSSIWWFTVSSAFFRSKNTPIIISTESREDVNLSTSVIIVC